MNKQVHVIREGFRGALYKDGVFEELLNPGRYEFESGDGGWFGPRKPEMYVVQVDTRDRSITLKGQEILTADKVAVRISVLVNFRVSDPVAALHRVASYEERIYEDVQLSARRFLSEKNLDEILTDRNEISDFVKADVAETAASYGVQITRADVKDLVFPGNLREIMNNVLETERRSEAMLIEAEKRAEAIKIESRAKSEALETQLKSEKELAQLVKDNPTLLRLKELEALQKMGESSHSNSFHFGLPPILSDGEGSR